MEGEKKKSLARFYFHTLDYPSGPQGIVVEIATPLLPIPPGSRDTEKTWSCDSKPADMQSGKPHVLLR